MMRAAITPAPAAIFLPASAFTFMHQEMPVAMRQMTRPAMRSTRAMAMKKNPDAQPVCRPLRKKPSASHAPNITRMATIIGREMRLFFMAAPNARRVVRAVKAGVSGG